MSLFEKKDRDITKLEDKDTSWWVNGGATILKASIVLIIGWGGLWVVCTLCKIFSSGIAINPFS